MALLFLDHVTQNKIYIQIYIQNNNLNLSLFCIFFTKSYSLRNSGFQSTDIQKKRYRVFLEVISSIIYLSLESLYNIFATEISH